MKLTLLSQNVQGLNNPEALNRVRNYFLPLLPQLDILNLQEHKLRGDKTAALGRAIWPLASFYSLNASPAYGHDSDQPRAGSGGLCTWVALAIKHLVTSTGQSCSCRAHWLRFTGVPGGDISILNVYAPNSSSERQTLWNELASVLPQDCRWILTGDWNVVERPSDKSTADSRILASAEKISFHQLLAGLEVSDSFDNSNAIRYTWDNK